MANGHNETNVPTFLDVVERQNLTLNHAKSVIYASSINVLGHLVRRTLGLFAYYAKWIPECPSKIPSLVNAKGFPLSTQAENAFNAVKKELEVQSLNHIAEAMPFVIE